MKTRRMVQVLLFVVASALSGSARALPNGTLVVTDQQVDPKSKTFERDLKKASRTALKKSGETWHLYFVAFLKKPAGAEEVYIAFYAVEGSKRENVNAFPIQTQSTAKILMSDIEISPEQGFKSGKKYEVLITRLIGGKEEVYAKSRVDLL